MTRDSGGFLPVNRTDMERRGWSEVDFVFISGDAYVDHPSFANSVIPRVLEGRGYRVGVIAQPDWRRLDDLLVLGRPRLGVLVSAGNLDSMLSHFTAAKKPRSDDPYSPGGRAGTRPRRATVVYCNRAREAWKDIPLIIGGVEASLRRFAHYDYWSDSVRRSILVDSKADLLVFGMGEKPILEITSALSQGVPVNQIRGVKGTCFRSKGGDLPADAIILPSFEETVRNRTAFAEAFRLQYLEQDPFRGRPVAQDQGAWYVVQNPPSRPLSTEEMDWIYDLPYIRAPHPMYDERGGVPAIEEVRFSITAHRGCFGSCSFCSISSHQGRIIQARSDGSILREARILTGLPGFKGYIHDVGGPTANFHTPSCAAQLSRGACSDRECLWPGPCPGLETDQSGYFSLLKKIRSLSGVKKVFVRSGIRYDHLLTARDPGLVRELCEHHVSGQLKVAPEHVSPRVLRLMRKPGKEVFLEFKRQFDMANRDLGKEQYLVPYLMSSHPGSTIADAVELAQFLKEIRYHPEQVQDFIPTPGTLSTCMFYTGIDPLSGEEVYVPRSAHERKLQRALLQYRSPANWKLVQEALRTAGRQDLIGTRPGCLVPPASQGRARGKGRQN
ncbi:MAG TPA: YgiQ family radical SAM protein [Thermovirgaceae bacterium]|nr:YgiQ family radical SAM protein [Thermovirgaceae bacterium]